MNDNYHQDLDTFQSLQKKAKAFKIVLPIVIVAAVFMVPTMISIMILPFISFSMTYECEGVDEQWLASHPFNTSRLPSKVKAGTEYTLEPTVIDGYEFKGWFVNGKSTALKNNVLEYSDIASSYISGPSIWFDRKVSARYEPIKYNALFDLGGGKILVNSDSTFDGKKYYKNNNNGLVFTSFICVEKEFELPQAVKDGKVFGGWENKNDGGLITSCTPSLCKSYALVAKWS